VYTGGTDGMETDPRTGYPHRSFKWYGSCVPQINWTASGANQHRSAQSRTSTNISV